MTNGNKMLGYMEATMLLLDVKNESSALGEEAWRIMTDIHETGAWRYWDDMLIIYGKERPWAFFEKEDKISDEDAMKAAKAHLAELTTEELIDWQETFMHLMVRCVGIKTIYESMKGAGK